MNVDDFVQSKYLKAKDLQGRPAIVIIERWEAVTMKDKDGSEKRQAVLYFRNKEKGLGLNITNMRYIEAMYGSTLDGWIGKTIEIYPTRTLFGNEMVDCIRVREPSQQQAQPPEPQPKQTYAQRRDPPINDPATQGPAPGPDLDDEIPF